jgi:hypothetical protein
MTNKMLKAALWYAKHGWHVIPLHTPLFDAVDSKGQPTHCTCEEWRRHDPKNQRRRPDYECTAPGKHPRLSKWEEKATTDQDQIRRWWRSWPNANIGIAAGKSGLVCLDLDTYQGKGDDLDVAEQDTVTSLTGGGGEHLIYLHPDGKQITNTDGSLPDWVNVRAHGGQFVAPPSLHKSGRIYEWDAEYGPHDRAPAPLPEKLRALLQGEKSEKQPGLKLPEEKIPTGKRHPTLVRAAGAMRHKGFGKDAIEAALLAVNEHQVEEPKDEDEIREIVEWVVTKEGGALLGANGHGPEAEAGAEQPGNPWLDQLRTLAHAYQLREPLRHIVAGVITEASMSMFFGNPGEFKSLIAADMGVCVAGGVPWLPYPDNSGGLAVSQCPVLWVDCDNGKRRSDSRFDALGKARNLPPDTPFHYLSMPRPALNMTQLDSVFRLVDVVQHTAAGLVVIDNLGLITGDTEENSAGMAAVMGELRRLAETTGAAVVIVHHQTKASDKNQLNMLRGHSSIAASLDLAIHVGRDMTEDRGSVVLLPVKMRDSDVPILAAEFSYLHDINGELEEARFFGRKHVDTTSRTAIKRAIIETLFDGKVLNQTALVESVKAAGITAGVNTIRSVIDNLALAGELNEQVGDRRAKLYGLA